MEKYYEILAGNPLFYGIDRENIFAMMGCIGGHIQKAEKNQPIFLEGDPAVYVGLVLTGAVRMERADFKGNRSIIALAQTGELFAETYACAGVPALPVSFIADEAAEVLLMDCRRITTSCAGACGFHSRMIQNLLRLVATRNMVYDQKIQITSRRSTREKLLTYLYSEAKRQGSNSFTIPYDRQELADYLEVDRSGLSAEISKLRKEGVLESEKGKFRILS